MEVDCSSGGRMLMGSGNNEFRFLFFRPGTQANEVRERSGVPGVEMDALPGGIPSSAFDRSEMPCKGSALLDLAFGPSKFNSCPPPRLPANSRKSSSGSLPGLNVPNLDLRFSTLCVFSSLTFRRGSGVFCAALFLFAREKGRNLDRFRCKES